MLLFWRRVSQGKAFCIAGAGIREMDKGMETEAFNGCVWSTFMRSRLHMEPVDRGSHC